MKLSFEREVLHRIGAHLLPVFSSLYQVPERLREYDPNLFVVLNAVRNVEKAEGVPIPDRTPFPHGVITKWGAWFEVHSLDHAGSTFVMTVPYGELDSRILRDIWSGDLRVHGDRIFRKIDEHNERLEAANRRDIRNFAGAMVRDSQLAFARASWGPSIFGPKGVD